MPDYKKMYFKMLDASEQALRIIIRAQIECEEMYINDPSPKLKLIKPFEKELNDDKE